MAAVLGLLAQSPGLWAQAQTDPPPPNALPAAGDAGPTTRANVTRTVVQGVVKNAATGEPLPRALVRIEGDATGGALTDGDGRFEISGVPIGPQAFQVIKPGFVDQASERHGHACGDCQWRRQLRAQRSRRGRHAGPGLQPVPHQRHPRPDRAIDRRSGAGDRRDAPAPLRAGRQSRMADRHQRQNQQRWSVPVCRARRRRLCHLHRARHGQRCPRQPGRDGERSGRHAVGLPQPVFSRRIRPGRSREDPGRRRPAGASQCSAHRGTISPGAGGTHYSGRRNRDGYRAERDGDDSGWAGPPTPLWRPIRSGHPQRAGFSSRWRLCAHGDRDRGARAHPIRACPQSAAKRAPGSPHRAARFLRCRPRRDRSPGAAAARNGAAPCS